MKAFNPKRLTDLRKRLGLTQQAFAKQIDARLTRQHVNAWEKGKSGLSLENLAKLSEAYDISIDYFFGQDYYSRNNKTVLETNQPE